MSDVFKTLSIGNKVKIVCQRHSEVLCPKYDFFFCILIISWKATN